MHDVGFGVRKPDDRKAVIRLRHIRLRNAEHVRQYRRV